MEIVLICIFIFFARVADMSLDVVRILMLTRGRKIEAALIGFIETAIFILALGQVLQGGLNNIFKVIAYAGGFAIGNYVGSIIEERIAMGHLTLQIFPTNECLTEMVGCLRERGFGLTCLTGQGRSGDRSVLYLFLKRKGLPRVLEIMNKLDRNTFYNISDTRDIRGGIFPDKRKGI